ncbi:UNVERIFIED_CONTAM: omega secalin, putative [Hammondia hammondi]|eukprot:XP_008885664.1 omega secalin, putative [Hammondia hammondi]
MELDVPGPSRRVSGRAYYPASLDGASLFDQLFPEIPFEGTSTNHSHHYAGHDTANVADSGQPKTPYSTGEVAGPASTIRSIKAPQPRDGSQQPVGGGTASPAYPRLEDFDLTLLSSATPAPQWNTSTNPPSENVAAKTQAVPTRGGESGRMTSPFDQLFREAAAFNERLRSKEAPSKSDLTSTSMHYQSAAPSSQNRPGSPQSKPSESGRTSGASAAGHKATASHVEPSDRQQNPFQFFVEPLLRAPKPTSAFAWPESGTFFEPVTSVESMTVSGGPGTRLPSTSAVKGPSAGPVYPASNEFGSLLAAAIRDAGWSDDMTEEEATDFVRHSITNLEELQPANERGAASTEKRPAAEGGTKHSSTNLLSMLLGPDTPTPQGSRSTHAGGPTKKTSVMGRQKPSSRSTSDSKVEGGSPAHDSTIAAPSTSIGAAVRERSKTSSPGSSSPQSKPLTEESFSLGTKDDESASMVEGDESQAQSSKATASATRRRARRGKRLNVFDIQPKTPRTRSARLRFERERNRGSVSTSKSPNGPATSAPGGSQGGSGADGAGLVAGSSVLPSAVQGQSYASTFGIPSYRESLPSSIQDVQSGGVGGAGHRNPNVRTPGSASPSTVFPFVSERLLKQTSKRQTLGLEGYTPSAKTRRETSTLLPSSLAEWQGLPLRTPMKSTSPGVSKMQPLSSLVASTSRGALRTASPGSMSPSSGARPQSLRAPSRASSSDSE